MAIKLPLFQDNAVLMTEEGKPSFLFHRWWQSVVSIVETSFNNLEGIVLDIQAAQDAATAAQTAADEAQTAATAAQTAADEAEATGAAAATVAKLSNSGIDGLTISAADAGSDVTVTISSHTRVYADDTQVSVTGTTITGLAYSTPYYFYYSDPTFAGGAVTYVATTVKTEAVQTGSRHLVGQVLTPAAAAPPSDGQSPSLPGFDGLEEY